MKYPYTLTDAASVRFLKWVADFAHDKALVYGKLAAPEAWINDLSDKLMTDGDRRYYEMSPHESASGRPELFSFGDADLEWRECEDEE